MTFRTTLAAAAAVAMLAGLAACGDDDDSDTASPGTTTDNPIGGSASEPSATPSHAGHAEGTGMITMTDNAFAPASLTVAPGTEVMVHNEGAAVHNLKDEDSKGKAFDSGDIDAGEDGSITAPDKAGAYPYVCTLHVGMEGTLRVK